MSPSHHPRMVTFNFSLQDHHDLPETSRDHPDVLPDEEPRMDMSSKFHTMALCNAISHDCSIEYVKTYIQHYRNDDEEEFLEMMHLATPCLYYAIGRNSSQLVTMLLEFGISPHGLPHAGVKGEILPPLAFAVIHGHRKSMDTTEIVKTLLAAGADPQTIPMHLWTNYPEKPLADWPSTSHLGNQRKNISWCRKETLSLLAQGLNLSQRYYLHQASIRKSLTSREVQLAEIHDAVELLKLPYRIIGQLPILESLQQTILDHLDSPSSLAIVFAGPPGHGKTELAQQLGGLLNMQTMAIACSQMKHDTELFGSKQGYERSSEGSQLNNHLATNNGKFSVAFLDEFDKTSHEVCAALLTVMSEGTYTDRRHNRVIDCSKTIWILASNRGDEAIKKFYQKDLKDKNDEERLTADLSNLERELRALFKGHWGNALTSRIDHIYPFFPFSHAEQAVVAHKFLQKDAAQVRQPINLSKDVARHMGHCILSHHEDWKLCSHMAQQGYDEDSGARGLKREASKVAMKARRVYNSIPGRVTQALNDGPYERLEVKLVGLGDQQYEVCVSHKAQD